MSDKKDTNKLSAEQKKKLKELEEMLEKGASTIRPTKTIETSASEQNAAQQQPKSAMNPEMMQMLAKAMQARSGKNPFAPGQKFDQTPQMPKKPALYTPKGLFIAILTGMSKSVKFVDQLVNFIANRKTKDSNDVLENARSPLLFGFWIIFIFVFLGTIWAGTAPLDSAAIAQGTVISDSKKRIINHPEGGIIEEIYVSVGDKISKGDKLIKLDDKRVRSEFETIRSKYRALLATNARLHAEINNENTISYPEILLEAKDDPEITKIIKTQDSLLASKIEAFNAEKDSITQKILQLKKQIETYEAKEVSLKKTLEIVRDRLAANRTLNKQGYAPKSLILELEDKETRVLSEIAASISEISRIEQQITEMDINIVNLKSKHLERSLGELRETQTQLPEFAERYLEISDKINRVLITSPVDGIVNKLEYTTAGMSIQAIIPIMEVSPIDDKLVIEAKISPKDIQSIEEGLISKIRFSAFKSRVSPIFLGKVISISPDIVEDTNRAMGGDPSLSGGYYLARIEIDEDDFHKKADVRHLNLKPGMQAEVQIVTGERTLLQYLLDPVIDAMFKGFKEK